MTKTIERKPNETSPQKTRWIFGRGIADVSKQDSSAYQVSMKKKYMKTGECEACGRPLG